LIRILLIPSSDYLGHPFPQRHNQIFERLHDGKNFEVHVARFQLFDKPKLKTRLVTHELGGKKLGHVANYYLINALNHAHLIRRIIKEESIDVVVLSNIATPFTYNVLDTISSLNVPTIFDLPDYYPTSATGYLANVNNIAGSLLTGLFGSMLRYIMRRTNVVTVASHALEQYAWSAGANNVAYVPNGIGECFLKLHKDSSLREKLGYSEEDYVVGYIGSLEFWLDMKNLIKGIALARKSGLPLKLLILGGKLYTNYSERVNQWIKQENIEKHTQFLGFAPYSDIPEYVSGLDVGTIPFDVSNPTAYYAAPNKMWEYFSQKKPVISAPIPEALSNSDCVFTASTPEDYAKLLLVNNGRETHQRVEIGYKKALKRTWQNSAISFASTIDNLLHQKGKLS